MLIFVTYKACKTLLSNYLKLPLADLVVKIDDIPANFEFLCRSVANPTVGIQAVCPPWEDLWYHILTILPSQQKTFTQEVAWPTDQALFPWDRWDQP